MIPSNTAPVRRAPLPMLITLGAVVALLAGLVFGLIEYATGARLSDAIDCGFEGVTALLAVWIAALTLLRTHGPGS